MITYQTSYCYYKLLFQHTPKSRWLKSPSEGSACAGDFHFRCQFLCVQSSRRFAQRLIIAGALQSPAIIYLRQSPSPPIPRHPPPYSITSSLSAPGALPWGSVKGTAEVPCGDLQIVIFLTIKFGISHSVIPVVYSLLPWGQLRAPTVREEELLSSTLLNSTYKQHLNAPRQFFWGNEWDRETL